MKLFAIETIAPFVVLLCLVTMGKKRETPRPQIWITPKCLARASQFTEPMDICDSRNVMTRSMDYRGQRTTHHARNNVFFFTEYADDISSISPGNITKKKHISPGKQNSNNGPSSTFLSLFPQIRASPDINIGVTRLYHEGVQWGKVRGRERLPSRANLFGI
jgi:hypothetical protein